ncbi:hypothetical protein SeMB42_g07676, partial [Synchytrium endobioticum]
MNPSKRPYAGDGEDEEAQVAAAIAASLVAKNQHYDNDHANDHDHESHNASSRDDDEEEEGAEDETDQSTQAVSQKLYSGTSQMDHITPATSAPSDTTLHDQDHDLQQGDTLESLKVKLEQCRAEKLVIETNSEQQAHTLAQRNKAIQDELQTMRSRLNECETESTTKNAAISATQAENAALIARVRSLETEILTSKATEGKVDSEKRDLAALLDRKQTEINNLREQNETQVTQMESLRNEYRAQSEEMAKSQSEHLKTRHQLDARIQEVDQLKKHNEWMNHEMARKAQEFQQYRSEKMEEISNLHQQLDIAVQERNLFESRAQSLSKKANGFEAKLTSALEKAQEMESRLTTQEQQFKTEMRIQKRLVEQSNSLASEREDQWKEMSHALAEREQESRDLAARLAELEQNARNDRASMQAELDAKEDELEVLRSRVTGLGSPAVTRVEASPFTSTSSPSSSITQLYARSHALEDENRVLKRRLEELEKHAAATADRVKHEIGPAYHQAIVENEAVKAENAKIVKELTAALKQREEVLEREQLAAKQISALKRERANMHGSIIDMKKTITALVIGLEEVRPSGITSLEARFGITVRAPPSSANHTKDGTSIDVEVFRSVDQLVAQNEGLKRSVISLSDELQQLQVGLSERIRSGLEDARQKDESRFISLKNEMRRITLRSIEGARPTSPDSFDGNMVESEFKVLYESTLRELENLRRETGIDTETLKADSARLSHENGELNVQLTRVKTQLELAEQRFAILNSHLEAKETELLRVIGSNRGMNTRMAAMDKRIQESDDKYRTALDESSKYRSDVSILRAQIDVLKHVEERSKNEVSFHITERQRLDLLLKDLQRAHDAFERTSGEQTRRLEERCSSLERELAAAKRQSAELTEELRAIHARRESEATDAHAKTERLNGELQKVQQDLAVSKTREEGLHDRVKDLTQRLAVAEERLAVYESRGARRSGNTNDHPGPHEAMQEMENQLINARTELDAANEDLRIAHERVTTFKAVADGLEQDLARATAAFDEYRRDTEAQIQHHQHSINQLQEEKRDVEERLSRAAHEAMDAIERADADRVQWEFAKKGLEDKMERLARSEAMAVGGQEKLRQDMLRQAQEVAEARRKYEQEIVEHSKVIQDLQRVKDELAKVQGELADTRERLAVSENTLRTTQASWEEMRRGLYAEVDEVKKNYDDLKGQNNLLLSQLEKVSNEATRIQTQEESNASGTSSIPTYSENLHQVIKFIRRERDILQSRHELALQETQRLRVQTEHLQRSLDETRMLLDEERQRSRQALDTERHNSQLLDQVNQINILRESNSTLRQQSEASNRRVSELETRLQQMQSELLPLREQVATLEAEVEERKNQNRLLEEDSNRWKARSTAIMQKYDRIDPVEHQALKDQNSTYSQELARLNSDLMSLRTELEALNAEKENVNMQKEQYRADLEAAKKEVEANADLVRRARATVRAYNEAKAKIITVEAEMNALRAQLETRTMEMTALQAELDAAKAKAAEEATIRSEQLGRFNESMRKAKSDRDSFRRKEQELMAKITEQESMMKAQEARISQLQSAFSGESTSAVSIDEATRLTAELSKSQDDLTAIRVEVEQLRRAAVNHVAELQGRDMRLHLMKNTIEKKDLEAKQRKEAMARLEAQLQQLQQGPRSSELAQRPVAPATPTTVATQPANLVEQKTPISSDSNSNQQTPTKRSRELFAPDTPEAVTAEDESTIQPAAKKLRSENSTSGGRVASATAAAPVPLPGLTPQPILPSISLVNKTVDVLSPNSTALGTQVAEPTIAEKESTSAVESVVEEPSGPETLEPLPTTVEQNETSPEVFVQDITNDGLPSASVINPLSVIENEAEGLRTPDVYEPVRHVVMGDEGDEAQKALSEEDDMNMHHDDDGEFLVEEYNQVEESYEEATDSGGEVNADDNVANVDFAVEQDIDMIEADYEAEGNQEEAQVAGEHDIGEAGMDELPPNGEELQDYEDAASPYNPLGGETNQQQFQEACAAPGTLGLEETGLLPEEYEDEAAEATIEEIKSLESEPSMVEDNEIPAVSALPDVIQRGSEAMERLATPTLEDEPMTPNAGLNVMVVESTRTADEVPVVEEELLGENVETQEIPLNNSSNNIQGPPTHPSDGSSTTKVPVTGSTTVSTANSATPFITSAPQEAHTPIPSTAAFSFAPKTLSAQLAGVGPATDVSPKAAMTRFGKLSGSHAPEYVPKDSNDNAMDSATKLGVNANPASRSNTPQPGGIKIDLNAELLRKIQMEKMAFAEAASRSTPEPSRKRVQKVPPRHVQDRKVPKPLPAHVVKQQVLTPATPISQPYTNTRSAASSTPVAAATGVAPALTNKPTTRASIRGRGKPLAAAVASHLAPEAVVP